jgi:drug/metabolite transporter (DMT)-like permease
MKNNIKPHLALLGTNIFFAINFTAIKFLFNNKFILPFGLNFTRMMGTTILLWILYFFSKNKESINRIHYKRFFTCALLGITINQILFIKGLSLTLTVHASLLMLTTPIFITIIAAWILKERLTQNKIIGLILGVTGSTLLIISRSASGNANDILLGDLYIIVNAICYSYYFVLVKPLMKRYDSLTVIRTLFTVGCVVALPFCWSEFIQTPWSIYTPKAYGALALVVIGGTFLAYLFNLYGIKHLGASVSGSYIYSQPLFATIIAMIFLGETIDLTKIIAAVCIFLGVYFVNKMTTVDIETSD